MGFPKRYYKLGFPSKISVLQLEIVVFRKKPNFVVVKKVDSKKSVDASVSELVFKNSIYFICNKIY